LPTPPLRSEPAITGSQSRPLPSLRILVVDHDATLCQRYSDELTHAGHRVDTAADDETGWKVLTAARHDPDSYHLLITNNELPKLSGVTLSNRRHFTPTTLLFVPESGTTRSNRVRLELAVILPRPVTNELLLQQVTTVGHSSGGASEF
jgi:DNA-binding response OmpR family regulator